MFASVTHRPHPVSHLAHALDSLRAAAVAPSSADERDELIAAALRAADMLTVTAVRMLSRRGVMDQALPTPRMLTLDARRLGFEARFMARAAGVLASMPRVADAAERGELSWGQVRGIVDAAARLAPADRERVDAPIAEEAARMPHASADVVLARAQDLIDMLEPERVAAVEEWARDRSFLAIQASLDGRVAKLYGEGDAESVATIAQALDAAARTTDDGEGDEDDENVEDERPYTRAQRRFDALVDLCERSLAGAGGSSTRPRPRILATIDVRDLEADGDRAGARLLWALSGRAPRLSPLATQALLCDAEILPVAFDNRRPVAVGDVHSPIPAKVRTAVVARDQRCRFPHCDAPVQACDAHHIVYRSDGGPSSVENLVLLCRGCHRRVHRTGWNIQPGLDGSITFTWRRRRYISPPPVRRE